MKNRRRKFSSPLLDRVQAVRARQQSSMSEGLTRVSTAFKPHNDPAKMEPDLAVTEVTQTAKPSWREALLNIDPIKFAEVVLPDLSPLAPFLKQSVASRLRHSNRGRVILPQRSPSHTPIEWSLGTWQGSSPSPFFIIDDVDTDAHCKIPDLAKLFTGKSRKVSRPTEEPQVPDSLQVLTGWRWWSVALNHDESHDESRLTSATQRCVWPAGYPLIAQCQEKSLLSRAWTDGQHIAPCKSCTCGVWAFKSLDDLLRRSNSQQFDVFGKVSLWGRVIEHEYGWRAELAYPEEIWIPNWFESSAVEEFEQLSWIYNVPIRTTI